MSTATIDKPAAAGSASSERIFHIKTALGGEALFIHRFHCREELGRLCKIELELLSTRNDLSFDKILGTNCSMTLELTTSKVRHFNGVVTRFSHTGFFVGRFHQYRASVRSWPWLLKRTADCRIFQNKTVPDIIKEIFGKYPDAKFEDKLSGKYQSREYCVQYRENDFDFVSRLMEKEGIFYFFKHEDGKHTMVLADSSTANEPAPDFEEVPFTASDRTASPGASCVTKWDCVREVQSGRYVLTDYDFEKPSSDLAASETHKRQHAQAEFEVFDYPGEYIDPDLGKRYVRTRIEELQCRHELAYANATARGLCTGSTFKLKGHPRQDQNREYLVVAEELQGENNILESGATGGAWSESALTVLHSKEVFRPARTTEHPLVQGPQTAVVVGPAGEEIWTDKHGRVKVQFHWDRYGKRDENSSCWVRVSHPWAGKGWGAISIPRIGQEVIVDFLEGDPEQPIITGRVYNANQMPPYGLPGSGMISGMKSNSTPGGGGYNEISADDSKGKEKITIHGQYDMNTTVLHDQTLNVTNNRTDSIGVDDSETVGSNQTQTIGSNQTIAIGANRTETVGGAESIVITGHRSETVNGGEDVTVNGARSHMVKGTQTTTISIAEAHTVGAGRAHTVGGAEAVTVGAAQIVSVGGAQMVSVGGVQKVNVGGIQSVSIGGPHKLSAAVINLNSKGVYKLRAAGTAMIEAPTIILKAGGSKIIMNSGGITIKGAKVTVKADGVVSINGGGGIKLKGPSIGEN